MLSLEGRMLGGCKLIRKIGEGGMGQVYLAEQIRVGNRLVAVKIVQPGDAARSAADVEEIERRFQREAVLLGQFSHPNILPVHDSGVEDGLLFLIMQYAPEGSLSDAIRGRAAHNLELPASLAFTTDMISQVAAALQYTHSRGIVHRDVKPANVLITIESSGHWHALLADFGIARGQDTTSPRTQVSGTFAYMAPELFSGKFSPASDQYALAVMAFQLLTGHVPFEGDLATVTHGHMYDQPPSVRMFNPGIPPSVDQVLDRALSKEPARRYPSVAEFAQALRAAAGDAAHEPTAALVPVPVTAATGTAGIAAVGVAAFVPPEQPGGPTQGMPPTPPAPQWPVPKSPSPRGGGLWRTWVAVLAAAILLIAIVAGSGYVARHQSQLNAQATQTAQNVATSAASQAQTQATQTASAVANAAQTAAAATATAGFTVPTASATSTLSADVTTPPPPPAGVNTPPVLSDPAPTCDQPQGPTWTVDSETTVKCDPSSGYPTISAQSTSISACIEQQTTVLSNGYFSAIADPLNGQAILAFREGNGETTGKTVQVTGYLFAVDKTNDAYALVKIDAAGVSHPLASGALPAPLGTHFALGVLFKSGTLAMYINGQQIGTATDTDYTQGWVGLCTNGVVTFRDAQAYSANNA